MHRRIIKILVFSIFVFTSYVTIYANDFVVQSFNKVEKDISAIRYKREDVNDIPCAIIKIRTDIPKPFVFDANLGVEGDIAYKASNEIWVYVSDGERQLTIAKEGFVTLKYAIPQKIEKSSVYSLVLKAKDNKISVVILSDPPDAQKYIDGELLGPGERFDIEKGQRVLEIKKEGYISLSKPITINEENALFKDNKLSRPVPTAITISSKPSDATIYLNNQDEGRTKKKLIKMPGEYQLRITKNLYEPIEKTITVSSKGENTWSYTLTKAVGKLSIKTTPLNAVILIDGEPLIVDTKELAAGEYQIEVRKTGWHSKIQNITMHKGVDQDISVQLVQKTGNLQLTVEPYETQILFKQNGKVLETLRGSQYKPDIPIGDYSIFLSANGYKNARKSFSIVEENTTSLDVKLRKLYYVKSRGKALVLSAIFPGFGQLYEGRSLWAFVYMVAEASLIYDLNLLLIDYDKLHQNYLDKRDSYSNFEGSQDEITQKWIEVQFAFDASESNYRQQQITMGLIVGAHVWNVADAWLFMPKRTESNWTTGIITDGRSVSAQVKVNLP
jgi:hypothetical protein